MNFHLLKDALPILKVLVVNSLARSSRLLIVKMLSGSVFGKTQLIDVVLMVYLNEKEAAEKFRFELISCAFPCIHSIIISSELPSITDADVFCFLTNFPNPNYLDFKKLDSDEHFDSFYLLIKLAHHFGRTSDLNEERLENVVASKIKPMKLEKKYQKPILVADGLIAIDILMSMSQNIPHDVFFCPCPHIAAAKSVLGDHLKIPCNTINDVLVWAANDDVFHVTTEKPIVKYDFIDVENSTPCDWDAISPNLMQTIVPDHTQFSPAWLKKDFVRQVAENVSMNPYGPIYKAMEMSRILEILWKSRSIENGIKSTHSMGVISDGSLETIKGCPYVLPIILSEDTWTAYKTLKYNAHVRQEIKRINDKVKQQHKKLIPYCKKFLEDNVIKQIFVPADDVSESIYSMIEQSSPLSKN